MSSSASASASTSGAGGDAAAPRKYLCYQCDRSVYIVPSYSGEVTCPICRGSFVEELDLPSPNPNAFPFHPPFSSGISNRPGRNLVFAIPPLPPRRDETSSSEPSAPGVFLDGYVANVNNSGNNIQVVFDSRHGGLPFASGNLGDDFFTSGLDDLIQQLRENNPNQQPGENDPNRNRNQNRNQSGRRPASKSAIDSLLDVTHTLTPSEDREPCPVCGEEFKIGWKVKQMPCKHLYHEHCIVKWLGMTNTCPVCRYELPTGDPDHESRRNEQLGQAAGPSGRTGSGWGHGGAGGVGLAALLTGEGAPDVARTASRNIMIRQQWPFVGPGERAEARNTRRDGGNNAGHGSNNAGDGGMAARAEARNTSNDGGNNAGVGGTAAQAEARNTSNDGGNNAGDGGNSAADGGNNAGVGGTAAQAEARNTSNDGGNNAGVGGTAAQDEARNTSNDGGNNAGDGGNSAADGGNNAGDGVADGSGGSDGRQGILQEELD